MSWRSPFELEGRWFKGNLHTHTTQSDGRVTPEQAIAWYRTHGYDFLALTDHWVLTPGSGTDGETDFVTISGTELDGPGYHMVGLGIAQLPERDWRESPQRIADSITEQGGVAFVAHPYWTGQTAESVGSIAGIIGFEAFNSVCEASIGRGHSLVHWDTLLAQGKRLWGLATDDVHWGLEAQGGGFVMLRATQLDEAHILQALREGHFYASSGPLIQDLRIVQTEDGQPALRVHCSPCERIVFHAFGPYGRRFDAEPGKTLISAQWPLRTDQIYLRVECRDQQGRMAWSNPVFLQDVL